MKPLVLSVSVLYVFVVCWFYDRAIDVVMHHW